MMFVFICEMVVLLFFNGYAYRPGLYADYYAENIFGHILPNATLWPATALLVVAYSLRYRWIALIAVVFTLLDVLFVHLGLYQHIWWKTWMTSVGIFGYCVLMQKWFIKLRSNRRGVLRFITFWFVLLVLLKLPVSILLLTGTQYTYVGWFVNLYRDSGVFSVFYNAALSFFCIFFLFKKRYWRLMPFLIYFICDALLLANGILFFQGGWNIYCLMLARIVSLMLFITLEKKYPYDPYASENKAL